MIQISNVTKDYPQGTGLRTRALDHVDLTIEPGEFVGIVGRNGSGKTTLARLLNGLLLPSSGQVLVDGWDTADPCHRQDIRARVGMVFQNPDNQIINPIVEEEVAFGVENLNLPSAEVTRRVDWVIELMGLSEWRHHAPHLLSGGQKQRLAIAAALAMGNSYLVLDEPTSMLDQLARRDLMTCLKRLVREEKITVILISHSMEEVAEADRLIVLHRGSIHLDGSPGQVFNAPGFVQTGLKRPPIPGLVDGLLKLGHQINQEIVTLEQMVEFLCQ